LTRKRITSSSISSHTAATTNGFGYFHDFLHLLFHTLAEPDFGNRLPGVPFLNGGLFDDDEFRLASSKLRLRNGTFANLFDDLLEAYNFTVREDTPAFAGSRRRP
jgi:hypothetical protein